MTTSKGSPSASRSALFMPSGVKTRAKRGWYPPRLSSRRRSVASFSESSMSSTRRATATCALFVRVSRKFGLLRRYCPVPVVPAAQREVEGGALAHPSLRPDPPSVPVYDPRDRRKTYARSLELVLPVQPLEGPEQLARVPLVEAGPVVPDVVNGGQKAGTGVPVRAELDARPRFSGGKLPRVAEQILERHLEQADVPPGLDVL